VTHVKASRPRDPQGRRRALSAAVVEVIGEVGVGRVTHRAVAARAGVPLGATTYYFPTLADLVTSGLEELADRARDELCDWAEQIGDGRDLPRTLSRLMSEYLGDRSKALLEYELYLAAARNPHLRPLAGIWTDGMRDLLIPITGPALATTTTALIDGVLLQALVTGEDPDPEILRAGLTQLLG
jgi:DNA-binding transcriptional regulator YbjK